MYDVMQWVDTNGVPASGFVLKAYDPGTTDAISIFIDKNGSSPQATITLDADGKPEVSGNDIVPFIDRDYKWAIFRNATDAGNNVSPFAGFYDNIPQSLRIDESKVDNIAFTQTGAGAVERTVDVKLKESVTLPDFMTTSEIADAVAGTGDLTTAVQKALDSGAKYIKGIAGQTYLVSVPLTMTVSGVIFDLCGSTIKQHATWAGTELITLTKEKCGVINGTILGNSVATDVTNGIQADFSSLTPRSESVFDNLLFKDMGDSGLKIDTGKGDKVTRIWGTNNHIATGQTASGNVRFDNCEEVQSSSFVFIDTSGKGVAWATSRRCTHDGLIVDNSSFVAGDTGLFTTSSDDIFITNVYCRNVNNKFSQFSTNINLTNFKLLHTGDTALRLQGSSRCKLVNGEIISSSTNRTCIINQHPDTGLGISNPTNNDFTKVRFEGSIESPLVLDANSSGHRFLDCIMNETALDATGAATDFVVIDSGVGNSFKECNVEAVDGSDFGGFQHNGASWAHTDCEVSVPFNPVNLVAAGSIRGGKYVSTDGSSDGIVAGAALRMQNAESLIDGSTVAVAALRLNALGNRITHSDIKTITDTTSGYGIRFGGADVEDTQILHCNTSGGNRSIKSVTQSTTNKLSFITIEGGGIDNGVNGTNDPGAHKAEFIGT